jgi:hypothetical protein
MASLISKTVNDVGTGRGNTSPRHQQISSQRIRQPKKKPHAKLGVALPRVAFRWKPVRLLIEFDCTSFVQKTKSKPHLLRVFYILTASIPFHDRR